MGLTKTFNFPNLTLKSSGGEALCGFSSIVLYLIRGDETGGPVNSIFHLTFNVSSLGHKTGHLAGVTVFGPAPDPNAPLSDPNSWPTMTVVQEFKASPMTVGLNFLGEGGGDVGSPGEFRWPLTVQCGWNNVATQISGTFDDVEDFDLVKITVFLANGTFFHC
jgi:hypothetical protein